MERRREKFHFYGGGGAQKANLVKKLALKSDLFKTILRFQNKLSRGEICVANLKAPMGMVRVWTGF